MLCRPSFMSPIDLLGFTAELNLTLGELLLCCAAYTQKCISNVTKTSLVGKRNLIEYTKA